MAASATRSPRRALDPDTIQSAAERLAVVSKPKRIALLDALNAGEAGVQELADRVGVSHQNASHHLCALWRAGVVSRRSEGTAAFYSIEDWSTWWVVEQIARCVNEPAG